jgi:hypothetical protein
MSEIQWGLEKREPKKKIDYYKEKAIMTIILPAEGEKTTDILFNSKATDLLGLDKNSVVSVSFKDGIVGNLTTVKEADGKTYFPVYTNNEYAGAYFINKPVADSLTEKYNLTYFGRLAHIELSTEVTEGTIPTLNIVGQLQQPGTGGTLLEKTVNYEDAV